MKQLSVIFFVLLATLIITPLKAYDTLLYRNAFEASRLKEALDGNNVDFVSVFLSIDSDSMTYERSREKLNTFYNLLDPKLAITKSPKQKAKLIFKEVHGHFFNQYEESVLFSRAFKDGFYNCVSASMLYAVILKHYEIPFEIKEKPTHVYLVAYPGTENILFETTNPRGFYVMDEKGKQEYLEGLITLKFTSREHVNSVGAANAFNEFFYNNQNISLTQLAGLQYYNQTIRWYEEKDMDQAIQCAVKMNMLYPCQKHQYVKASLLTTALANSNYDSIKEVLFLCQYANTIRDIKDRKMVIGEFEEILQKKLYKESDQSFAVKAFELVQGNIDDKKLIEDLTYSYYTYTCNWYAMKGDWNNSLTFANKAYLYNQKDVRLHDLIVRAIISMTENVKDKQKNVETLDAYIAQYPFITTNKNFRMIRLYHLSMATYSLFNKDKGTEGYKRMEQLEAELKSETERITGIDQMIGMAFAEAGAYHYRKKEYTKAKEILLKGLKVTPDHPELVERLRIVEDDLER
ncbi:MAG: hypothetical protein ABI663_20445 [Chryseolinea sp.]